MKNQKPPCQYSVHACINLELRFIERLNNGVNQFTKSQFDFYASTIPLDSFEFFIVQKIECLWKSSIEWLIKLKEYKNTN